MRCCKRRRLRRCLDVVGASSSRIAAALDALSGAGDGAKRVWLLGLGSVNSLSRYTTMPCTLTERAPAPRTDCTARRTSCVMVNIREYPIRPGERAVASWPEGDGAGMCTGSSWPDVSVSAQVVDVSGRGARGSLGSGRSAGCAIGEDRTSPQWSRRGSAATVSRAGSNALAWLPGPSETRERPARRVFTRSGCHQRAPSGAREVCVCGLVSGVLWRVCRGMSRGRGGISHGSSRFVIVKFPVISPGSAPHFRLRGPREQATRPTSHGRRLAPSRPAPARHPWPGTHSAGHCDVGLCGHGDACVPWPVRHLVRVARGLLCCGFRRPLRSPRRPCGRRRRRRRS